MPQSLNLKIHHNPLLNRFVHVCDNNSDSCDVVENQYYFCMYLYRLHSQCCLSVRRKTYSTGWLL